MDLGLTMRVGESGLAGPLLWMPLVALAGAILVIALVWRRGEADREWAQWESDRRGELEAYCELEISLGTGQDPRKQAEQAKRVCRAVVDRSLFAKAALLLSDADGRMRCVGSAGLDDVRLAALAAWGDRLLRQEGTGDLRQAANGRSFTVDLGEPTAFAGAEDHGCGSATLLPLRMHRGRVVGVLAVCLHPETGARAARARWMPAGEWMPRAVMPLEMLAAKLARTFERSLLIERLMQVERLAGAGHLVAGVAQELTNPLVGILGTAELMAQTATEPRIRQEAEAIVTKGLRMQETLCRLRDFWRPRLPGSSVEAEIGKAEWKVA